MTDLRKLAAELALKAWQEFSANQAFNTLDFTGYVESAIKEGMRAALAEPDEGMIENGGLVLANVKPNAYGLKQATDIWNAMARVRAESLK